jgi:hypothetical protein
MEAMVERPWVIERLKATVQAQREQIDRMKRDIETLHMAWCWKQRNLDRSK